MQENWFTVQLSMADMHDLSQLKSRLDQIGVSNTYK